MGLRKGFTDLGFDIGNSETPIIPVMLGDEDLAKKFSAKLFEEGVFASAICFPMVPRGTARVRVIVSASFSKDDCDVGLAAFKKVQAELSGCASGRRRRQDVASICGRFGRLLFCRGRCCCCFLP